LRAEDLLARLRDDPAFMQVLTDAACKQFALPEAPMSDYAPRYPEVSDPPEWKVDPPVCTHPDGFQFLRQEYPPYRKPDGTIDFMALDKPIADVFYCRHCLAYRDKKL
jgi:hypothetical protein